MTVLLLGWTILSPMAVPGAETKDTSGFGFGGPEIFPVDYGIAFLRAADFNADGLQDLVVANNARSKITILWNRTGQDLKPEDWVPEELNDLPPDARFRLDAIASEKRISALVVADLNGDAKPDMAYYGEPKELVVQYNEGTNGWSVPKRWAIGDGQLTPNALTAGDINGDGRADLLLLGERHVHILRQTETQSLGEPERIPYAGENKSVQDFDINGDKRKDLLLVNWDHPNPFRFRLQLEGGTLGPEHHFPLPPIRSYWADDLDGDSKTEVVTIAMQSGRAQIWNFVEREGEAVSAGLPASQFQVLPLPATALARRGLAWVDLNRDRGTDLLVAEPDSGQLGLYLQRADGSLPLEKNFPSLAGVTDLVVRHDPGQDTPEIFVLSAEERQVGVSKFEPDGRIPFPVPLPIKGKPLAMTLGRLEGGEGSTVAVVVDDEGRRRVWFRSPNGELWERGLSDDFKANPATLVIHDVDQDGRSDVVMLVPYEKVKILRQSGDRTFEEFDIAPPGGALEKPWVSQADVDGDGRGELLLGQKNFVRAVVLSAEKEAGADKPAWTFRVVDQINGVNSRSRIVAAAPLTRPGEKIPWILLLDAERKELSVCERDAMGVWVIQRNLPLPYSDFQSLEEVHFQGDTQAGMALVGLNALGWVRFTGRTWELAELDSYESPLKDARLFDVVSGDLNQDGRKDLVFLETARNYLDVVLFEPSGKMRSALRWPVFAQRTFRGRRASDQTEPREAVIVDLTGDGRNDLAIVVHDRILVYPQE